MAKAKSKAGKKKGAVTQPRVRKPARPAATPAPKAAEQSYPCTAHVHKGSEKIPVQLKDAAHHERLKAEFGADKVEVLASVPPRAGKYR